MNKVVEEAKKINEKGELNSKCCILNVDIGDVVEISELITDENSLDVDEILEDGSISHLITHDGEDGISNFDIWINYQFKVVEVADWKEGDHLHSLVKITEIELL